MPSTQPEDLDRPLLERTAQRDKVAFAELMRRHFVSLRRFAVRFTGNEAAADDALQDAALAAWEHAESFRGESTVRSWLYALTRNACRNRFRQSRAAATESIDELGEGAGFADARALDEMDKRLEERESLSLALRALSQDDQELLALVDIEELSVDEAAMTLSITAAALKSRLHRARLRLMCALRDVDIDEGRPVRSSHEA